MGSSKDLFLMMREQEVNTTSFAPTKKEIKTHAADFAKKLIESGEVDKIELLTQAVRINESVSTVLDEIKNSIDSEDFEAFGVKGKYSPGYDKPNFEDDPIYLDLKEKLKQREDLLKVALKSKDVIYDSEGIEVPKVGTTPTKGSLRITF